MNKWGRFMQTATKTRGLKIENLADEDYYTMKIPLSELEINNYIMQKRGWNLATSFRVDNEKTVLCTYKKLAS